MRISLSRILAFGAAVALGSSLSGPSAKAQETSMADQPNVSLPLAVTDHSSQLGFQPRAWMVTNGGKLVSKATALPTNGWLETTITGVTSGLAAVSWGASDGFHQRVFYARNGGLQRADFLDDGFQSISGLGVWNAQFSGTDIAAVSYVQNGVTRNAVAAVSTMGKFCVWDGPVTSFMSYSCTQDNMAAPNGSELVGATVNGHVMFVYRHPSGALRRARKISGAAQYQHEFLPFPPGASSVQAPLALQPSQVSGSVDLLVAEGSGTLWVSRMRPQLNSVDSWHVLPALPEPLANARSALGIAPHTRTISGRTGQVTNVYARSSDHHLFMLASDLNGDFAGAAWERKNLPGGQRWFALGEAHTLWTGLPYAAPAHLFGIAGEGGFWFADTTFQEFDGALFRDHLRPVHSNSSKLAGFDGTSATQSHDVSVSGYRGGLIFVGATSTVQQVTSPWQVTISQSLNGGQTFSKSYPLSPIAVTPGASSMFAPDLSLGDDAYFHHVASQTQVTQLGTMHCTTGATRDIVYRRAPSADQLAALNELGPDAMLLASGDVEHGAVLSTGQGNEARTHFLYWDHNEPQITYARFEAGGWTRHASPLEGGRGELIKDAAGHVYGYRRAPGAGPSTLCRLWPEPPEGETDCGLVGAPFTNVVPTEGLLPFGPTNGPDRCNGQSGAQACVDAANSIVIVSDPVTPRRFYAAFQRDAGFRLLTAFTRTSSDSLNDWTSPVDVVDTTFGRPDVLDPSLSVDENGAIIVSVVEMLRGTNPGNARNLLALSSNGGLSFTYVAATQHTGTPTFSPFSLPFNCASKRYELGHRRKATSFGARALHAIRQTTAAPNSVTEHAAYGVSPYALVR